jgi:hypothetical protein
VRWLLVLLRSVPELVWALLFVRIIGLGPTAGVLAIALTYCGMLGKVYAEILESSDAHATDTLLANGSGRLAALLYGALPEAASELVSYTVYRWECAIRGSVIMGFVGAGGLGQRMDESMKMLAGRRSVRHADGVRAAGGAGRPGLENAAPEAGMNPMPTPPQRSWTGPMLGSACWRWWWPASPRLPLHCRLFHADAVNSVAEFLGGFAPPELARAFSLKPMATLETLSMSALGTCWRWQAACCSRCPRRAASAARRAAPCARC